MVHCLHDRRFIFKNALSLLGKSLLRNDLERGLLLRQPILDEKNDTEGANAEQVPHTEHICEAVKLLALGLAIFIEEGLR